MTMSAVKQRLFVNGYEFRKSNKKVTGINNNTKSHAVIFTKKHSKPLIQQHFTIK